MRNILCTREGFKSAPKPTPVAGAGDENLPGRKKRERISIRVGCKARVMQASHQHFVANCAKANIGPVKSYRLFKEMVGGYGNIGATIVDFKNFKRDLQAYIAGGDAQLMIEKFFYKQETNPGYFFEYDVDKFGQLSKLFWADPISQNNFSVFGDILSFNATYRTNR